MEEADHVLKKFSSDELHDMHHSSKRIGVDFVMEQEPDGDWVVRLMVGDTKAFVGANEWEIALWKSRSAMYDLFKKIYAAQTLDEVRQIIDSSRLDKGLIHA